ncbi:MAG: hypothetical protein JNJ47_08250 [Alphaproteobacteria bacterium]|nr:hypothetical protein [Alphaproteobacteria bacterium]
MKNLILTTASALALSAFAVQAAPTKNMNDKGSQTGSQTSSLAADEATAPATNSSTSSSNEAKPAGQPRGKHKPHAQHHEPHAKHLGEHKAGYHRKHHGKHSASMGHPQYPNQADIGGVFVTFPPMDLGDACRPEFYAGRTECPYVYHGGYFWYPHINATMLEGYTPSLLRGMYWYPSYMHPYVVYAQKAPVVYTIPYVLSKPLPSDSAMYKAQTAPMRKKWESAPEMQPGQVK